MAICGYFFATAVQAIYEVHPNRLETLCFDLFFVFLFLTGAVASFFLVIGAKWSRIVLSMVALLNVTASVMGLFAFFNSPPFSAVGIAYDIFALACAGVLLFSRRYPVANKSA
jgi:hypothetical protein